MTRLPKPTCSGFLLCRDILIDTIRQDYTLVSPVHQVFSERYPLQEDLSVFARWSSARGSYVIEVLLRNLEGDVLWREAMERPFELHDPLRVCILTLRHLQVLIPEPGKYEFALLASGEEVACDTLHAYRVRPESQ